MTSKKPPELAVLICLALLAVSAFRINNDLGLVLVTFTILGALGLVVTDGEANVWIKSRWAEFGFAPAKPTAPPLIGAVRVSAPPVVIPRPPDGMTIGSSQAPARRPVSSFHQTTVSSMLRAEDGRWVFKTETF